MFMRRQETQSLRTLVPKAPAAESERRLGAGPLTPLYWGGAWGAGAGQQGS